MSNYQSSLFKCYQSACDLYLQAFCQKHNLEYDDAYWVAGEPGTIALISDFFFDMETLIVDIEEHVKEDIIWKYYEYCLDENEGYNMNYKTWLKVHDFIPNDGPSLDKLQNDIKETKRQLIENIENFKNNL